MSRTVPVQCVALEARRLFSGLPFDLPGVIDPGQFENFNGVKIDASQFPDRPVTVQVTSTGPVVALPMLRNGVVTGSGTPGADQVTVGTRVGVDPASNLPGIVFLDGVEAPDAGVQILGNVRDGVAGYGEVAASLQTALAALQSTRASLAAMGLDTAALDQQIASFGEAVGDLLQTLNQTLTASFVRVTVAGHYDAYFLASKVTDVRFDALGGNDVVTSALATGRAVRLDGGAGNDVVTANGRATLLGGAGNDRLVARDASWLDGGEGNDTLVGSGRADTLIGGGGDDVLDTGTTTAGVRDVVNGGAGRDRMIRGAWAQMTSVEIR
jgi:Ca2+-binding RTX toxin-like protein